MFSEAQPHCSKGFVPGGWGGTSIILPAQLCPQICALGLGVSSGGLCCSLWADPQVSPLLPTHPISLHTPVGAGRGGSVGSGQFSHRMLPVGSQLENTDLQQPAPHAGWKFSTDAVIPWEWGMCAGWGGLEFLPVCPAMGWCSGKLRHGSMGSWERSSVRGLSSAGLGRGAAGTWGTQ